jgi:hypothetical protein
MVVVTWHVAVNWRTTKMIIADGMDYALLGATVKDGKNVAVYSVERCVETLINDHGMEAEEAWEYFDFNILGAYVGEQTPIFVYENWEQLIEGEDDE